QDVRATTDDEGGGGETLEQDEDPRADPLRRRDGGPATSTGRAGEVEEVVPLVVVEPERRGDRLEHVGRDVEVSTLLEARVVVDAHRGQTSELLAPQPGHSSGPQIGRAH